MRDNIYRMRDANRERERTVEKEKVKRIRETAKEDLRLESQMM